MLWGTFRFIYPYYLRNPLFIGLGEHGTGGKSPNQALQPTAVPVCDVFSSRYMISDYPTSLLLRGGGG